MSEELPVVLGDKVGQLEEELAEADSTIEALRDQASDLTGALRETRLALAALAAKWKAEADDADPGMEPGADGAAHYDKRKAVVRQKRVCARQLLQALGQPS
jgi:predicted  nucleic acid-binding Zn-ribbon protein